MKISGLIKSQLPSFIAKDKNYSSFVSFLESYYEWMEKENNVLWTSENILNFIDINKTLDDYVDHFYRQYMPEIPKYIAADKRKLLKFIKDFYRTKGTNSAYKFLFRVLYNSSCEILETEDFVLKTSGGEWFNPTSIKLKSNDVRFFFTKGYFVLGVKSRTFARISEVMLVNEKIELILSDIKNTFDKTEEIKIVDDRKRDVYLNDDGERLEYGNVLKSTLYRPISNVKINPKFRGNYYFENNPVVVYGGLDPEVPDPKGATVVVGSVNAGYITEVKIDANSCVMGYTQNTRISVYPDNNKTTILEVGDEGIDYSNSSNVKIITIKSTSTSNLPAKDIKSVLDANSKIPGMMYNLPSPLSLASKPKQLRSLNNKYINTGNLTSVIISNGGGGFTKKPELFADCMYVPFENKFLSQTSTYYDPRYDFDRNNQIFPSREYKPLSDIGMLAPIIIENGGQHYTIDDEISITVSSKVKPLVTATAQITSVNSNGKITEINYLPTSDNFMGGRGYIKDDIPEVNVIPKTPLYTFSINTESGNNKVKIISASPPNITKLNSVVMTGDGKFDVIPKDSIITAYDSTANIITLSKACKKTTTNLFVKIWAYGAKLYIPGLFGSTAKLIPITDRIGSINTFKILDYGEDYVESPNISLKVEDFIIAIPPEIYSKISNIKKQGDFLIGLNGYKSKLENFYHLFGNYYYICRTYDYNRSVLDKPKKKITTKEIYFLDEKSDVTYSDGILTFANEIDDVISSCVIFDNNRRSLTTIKAINHESKTITLNSGYTGVVDKIYVGYKLGVQKLSRLNDDIKILFNDHHIKNGIYYDLNYSEDKLSWESGVITYGDGSGRATCGYLNGIILGDGRYLNDRGHISGYNLIQDDNHNSFTYSLSVEVELMKFKRLLKDILHPAGTKVIPRIGINSNPHKNIIDASVGNFDNVNLNVLLGVLSTEYDDKNVDITITGNVSDDKIKITNSDDVIYLRNVTVDGMAITSTGIIPPMNTIISRYDSNECVLTLNNKVSSPASNVKFIIKPNKTSKIFKQIAEPSLIAFDDDIIVNGKIISGNSISIKRKGLSKLKLKGLQITAETIKIPGVLNNSGTAIENISDGDINRILKGQYLKSISIGEKIVILGSTVDAVTTNSIRLLTDVRGKDYPDFDIMKKYQQLKYSEKIRRYPYNAIPYYEFSILPPTTIISDVKESGEDFILTFDKNMMCDKSIVTQCEFTIISENLIKIQTEILNIT